MENNTGRQANKPPAHWGGSPTAEELDTTPVEMPMGACRPKPLVELIADMVRQQVEERQNEQVESFGDADDFDDPDPEELDFTRYELLEIEDDINPFHAPEPTQEAAQANLASDLGATPTPELSAPPTASPEASPPSGD